MTDNLNNDLKVSDAKLVSRRKLVTLLGVSGIVVGGMPERWSRPIINSVLLPAHAQTTGVASCNPDIQIGGPLAGNASGASNCAEACEAEAVTQNGELCGVTESTDATGNVICGCDIDVS